MQVMELHAIQKHILRLLLSDSGLTYAKLKPDRVEGNQFTYHLKKLVQHGYVKKRDRSYELTTMGVRYTNGASFEYFSQRIQPKVATLVVCKNKRAEYLLYKRREQPFLGMVGFPYGEIPLGEKIQDAAQREFLEKTGISAKLAHKGIAYWLVRDREGEVIIHTIFHVFAATSDDMPVNESSIGKLVWVSERELRGSNCMPGLEAILKIAKHPGKALQFQELEYQAAE